MHTIETAIVMPVLFFFIFVSMSVCLRYMQRIVRNADALRESAAVYTISNTDIARGGAELYALYQRHAD
ncbi:MAG: TadE/TadG family type IV pilus assembly protein [Clostridia bacterium]